VPYQVLGPEGVKYFFIIFSLKVLKFQQKMLVLKVLNNLQIIGDIYPCVLFITVFMIKVMFSQF